MNRALRINFPFLVLVRYQALTGEVEPNSFTVDIERRLRNFFHSGTDKNQRFILSTVVQNSPFSLILRVPQGRGIEPVGARFGGHDRN